jgi:hypothetical protein
MLLPRFVCLLCLLAVSTVFARISVAEERVFRGKIDFLAVGGVADANGKRPCPSFQILDPRKTATFNLVFYLNPLDPSYGDLFTAIGLAMAGKLEVELEEGNDTALEMIRTVCILDRNRSHSVVKSIKVH